MNETAPNTCPQCEKPLPADAPGGLCPNCVMAMNLATETRMNTTDSATSKAPPSPEEMAERFPNFAITECLGRGGMGVVYKARQKALDREVAIKMLTGERPGKDVVAPSRKVEVDVKIDEMVLRALEKEPERRYQTAREFQTTAELAMTPLPSARQEDAAPTATQITHSDWQSPDSGWGWFIGKLFGCTFTSPTAYKVANFSALGFLGCLGFLGHIPQLAFAKSLFGLFGLWATQNFLG